MITLLAGKLEKKAMIVGRHSFEVDDDSVVARYVSPSAHAPAARTQLHATACFRFRQDEKMAAFGGGLRYRRHGGGTRRGAADGGTVAAVAEVEDGEVKSLTAADGDA